jgi:rRNA processing protein Gar1
VVCNRILGGEKMKQIPAKIYYDIKTGDILTITSEMQGSVIETTKEQDIKTYEQLKDKNVDELGYIELEYGTVESAFANVKSCKVNLELKKIDFIYYTQEEIDEIKTKKEQQIKKTEALNSSISNISEYLKLDSTNIDSIENYIIQNEQNKILGVV